MAKKKSTKKALLASVLALTLSSSMLVGTTFAWFTDSVTSSNNIIQTGTLDVSLEYSDEVPTGVNDAKWVDASQGTIFNYSNWEPGYTAVKYVKIENEGSLDLKFTLSIIPNGEAGEVNLADVIEVYMVSGATAVERSALTPDSAYYVGNLTSLMNDKDGAAHGVLYADDADKVGNVYEVYTIALKMSTSAGNEYQGKSVGGEFAVQLLATQLASENDSLGSDYDEDAPLPIKTNSVAELLEALEGDGEKILNATGVNTTLNSLGTTNTNGFTNLEIKDGTTVIGLAVKFENSNEAFLTDGTTSTTGEIVFENCTFSATSSGPVSNKIYFQSGENASGTKLVFNNCTFKGAVVFADNTGGGIEFNDCVFMLNEQNRGYVQCMGGTQTFNDCQFNYDGGSTNFAAPTYNYNKLNVYSDGYDTLVILNACTNVSTFKYENGGTGSITVN